MTTATTDMALDEIVAETARLRAINDLHAEEERAEWQADMRRIRPGKAENGAR